MRPRGVDACWISMRRPSNTPQRLSSSSGVRPAHAHSVAEEIRSAGAEGRRQTRGRRARTGATIFIYCAGLLDYLPDRTCAQLMNVFHDWVAPGGLLAATSVEDCKPFRHMLEFVLDWHLIYRSPEERRTSAEASAAEAPRILRDSDGSQCVHRGEKTGPCLTTLPTARRSGRPCRVRPPGDDQQLQGRLRAGHAAHAGGLCAGQLLLSRHQATSFPRCGSRVRLLIALFLAFCSLRWAASTTGFRGSRCSCCRPRLLPG